MDMWDLFLVVLLVVGGAIVVGAVLLGVRAARNPSQDAGLSTYEARRRRLGDHLARDVVEHERSQGNPVPPEVQRRADESER